ncbi:alpha-L-rhamnosidase-related protein [Bifidobacterium commune]|uniref:alpha-L-rhamnosidase-related protein n=1 Tax=Bifidobacterium commune TaxID=1505727 RepID=UPI0035D3F0B6
MDVTGGIETDNPKVNRLLSNILWSQKSNCFDVPTDSLQRDECLGWSADAAVFCSTALLNMDSYAFYKKYAKDMQIEQNQHDCMLPVFAPAMPTCRPMKISSHRSTTTVSVPLSRARRNCSACVRMPSIARYRRRPSRKPLRRNSSLPTAVY